MTALPKNFSEALHHRMAKPAIAGIVILSALLAWWILRPTATAEVGLVTRGRVVSAVYATVSAEPIQEAILRTRDWGSLQDLKVKLNEKVKAGQVLAQVKNNSIQGELDIMLSQLEQARLKQNIGPPSQPSLNTKETEVKNLKRLLDAQNISPVEYERGVNELQALRDRVKTEQIGLDTEVSTLQGKVKGLMEQVNQTNLVSPMDGIVLDIYQNIGESLPPSTQILRVGSAANQIIATVNEEDVGGLKTGMKAQVKLYSLQKNLTATLKEILPSAVNQGYRVAFLIDENADNLLPGMTGEMNIIIGQRENALQIPSRAVRQGNQVLVVHHGKVTPRTIKIGFHGIERSEVLEGLEENEKVILNDQDSFLPGQRVSVKVNAD